MLNFICRCHYEPDQLNVDIQRILAYRSTYEADPFDFSISNACSATMIHESISRFVALSSSFSEGALGKDNISGVHCMSGWMPTWSISCSAGERYFATVINRADPSSNSKLSMPVFFLFQKFCGRPK
ncbi:Os06g0318566 [Oryza sativa Japonica Group]|uniref:Os06g0318566 protein n=1 Tax=Oryza sativa subsp. japonica TaxID=39947 RepID=A0A0P0WVT9_ORYSJ|nr:hypothetical protein EE612_033705 [Oryza sativa]BAS97487.1 Os06g0318566 [Oryza sativa Japonica Group]